MDSLAPPTAAPPRPPLPKPSIRAVPFIRRGDGQAIEMLTPAEQAALLRIAKPVEVRRNTVLYAEGGESRFVYNIVSGVVETYHLLADGGRRVTAFLFPSDLLGLSENGQYVATAQALTPVVAYKLPIDALEQLIRRDPRLDAELLCKLCHELRQSEWHGIIASQRDARIRVAGFVLWMHRNQPAAADTVALPMTRHDIADYLGLTVESVSRALQSLEAGRLLRRLGPRLLRLSDLDGLREAAQAQ